MRCQRGKAVAPRVRGESWREFGAATAARSPLHGTHYPPIVLTLSVLRMKALAGVAETIRRQAFHSMQLSCRSAQAIHSMHVCACSQPRNFRLRNSGCGILPPMFTLTLGRPGLAKADARIAVCKLHVLASTAARAAQQYVEVALTCHRRLPIAQGGKLICIRSNSTTGAMLASIKASCACNFKAVGPCRLAVHSKLQ
jgi:hypothetical protein